MTSPFAHAHAVHPDWRMALGLVLTQLQAQRPAPAVDAPTLGWCYFSDHHAPAAEALLAGLRERFPGAAWVGAVGVGVCAGAVEYFDEPGLVVMLAALPREQFRVFSGQRPLPAASEGFRAYTAQVHADPATPELGELIGELGRRVDGRYLFGGLASSRNRTLTLAAEAGAAGGVYRGGLSGVAFSAEAGVVSRVSQGCQPIGTPRRITESERNIVYALDGEPALDVLLRDLGVDENLPREALPRLRHTLAGLSEPEEEAEFGLPAQNPEFATVARRGSFGTETRVRHIVGVDPQRRGVAVAELAPAGHQLAFCRRDVEAARRDLVRIGAEIRSALEPEELPLAAAARAGTRGGTALATGGSGRRMLGAVYVSCTGRGGAHFGAPSAELQLVRHALGGSTAENLPLVGFFAAGEIGHRQLYGYTGVLTVFTAPG